MHHQLLAARLSHAQREMLISLIDGPLPFVVSAPRHEQNTRRSLFELELLHLSGPVPKALGNNFYALTDDGRQVVCCILAECAEILSRAETSNYAQIKTLLDNLRYGFPAGRELTDVRPRPKDKLLAQLRANAG